MPQVHIILENFSLLKNMQLQKRQDIQRLLIEIAFIYTGLLKGVLKLAD